MPRSGVTISKKAKVSKRVKTNSRSVGRGLDSFRQRNFGQAWVKFDVLAHFSMPYGPSPAFEGASRVRLAEKLPAQFLSEWARLQAARLESPGGHPLLDLDKELRRIGRGMTRPFRSKKRAISVHAFRYASTPSRTGSRAAWAMDSRWPGR